MQVIVNVTSDWGIGRENQLLVAISEDLKRFRRLTAGKTVVLGRSTLATFPQGQPLKNRRNLILSRQPDFSVPGAEVFPSLPALLCAIKDLPAEEVWVIGGASVYEALLPYCQAAFITKTHTTLQADRFFPNLDAQANWSIQKKSGLMEQDGLCFEYIDYQNSAPKPLP